MKTLFEMIFNYDYLMNEYPEREDEFYEMQEKLVKIVNEMGLEEEFDKFVEENQRTIF